MLPSPAPQRPTPTSLTMTTQELDDTSLASSNPMSVTTTISASNSAFLSCQAGNCLPILGQSPPGTTWFASVAPSGCSIPFGTSVVAFDAFQEVASAASGEIFNCECTYEVDGELDSQTYGIQTVCDSNGYIFNGTAWGKGFPGAEGERTFDVCSATTGMLTAEESWCVVQTANQGTTSQSGQPKISQDPTPQSTQGTVNAQVTSKSSDGLRAPRMLALNAFFAGVWVLSLQVWWVDMG